MLAGDKMMNIIFKEKPPIILVSGDADTIVSFDENGKLLYDFYTQNGGKIELYMKKAETIIRMVWKIMKL